MKYYWIKKMDRELKHFFVCLEAALLVVNLHNQIIWSATLCGLTVNSKMTSFYAGLSQLAIIILEGKHSIYSKFSGFNCQKYVQIQSA